MEALYCGNLGQANAMVGQRVLQQIGQTGVPGVNCANACATGATAFREAWMAIKAGVYDLVLAVGVEKMGGGLLGGAGGGAGIPKEGLLGSGTMPAVFAEAGMEHSRKYGTTFAQFAKVSVKNHHHSTMNPEVDVPDRDAARDGDERGDDRLPEHQADVLGERGRPRRPRCSRARRRRASSA
jgi:acetyl-CoA acetyltransferase